MKTIIYSLAILSLLNCSKDKSVANADLMVEKSASYNAPPPPPNEEVSYAAMEVVDSAAVKVDASLSDQTKPINKNEISKKNHQKW